MLIEKTDKKDHILIVAEKVFSELGYDGASTRLIAKEASVNMAMLNYYFGSKDGLFKAVFERRSSTLGVMLHDINEENISSWEKLEKCVNIYIERIMPTSCFYKLVYRELSLQQRSEHTQAITSLLLKNVMEIKKVITDGIDNGSFNQDVDVEMLIASLLGTKYYIMNAPSMSSAFLELDVEDEKVLVEQIKPRMKKHLINLLKAYLIH
ncbi:MAG: TetR/AcrR family transcriptional regulator [Arcticibacter sp.]